MTTIALRLDPRELTNPDLDIRYALPDLLIERSRGVLADDGYDYVGASSFLIMFLKASLPEVAIGCVLDAIETCRVLENDLRGSIVVAVDRGCGYEVVYPTGFRGDFPA